MRIEPTLILCLLSALLIASCEVEQIEEGEMPEVDVVEGGNLPEYDVDAPDVDTGTQETEVEVPDVDTETETVTVPSLDVEPTAEEEEQEGNPEQP